MYAKADKQPLSVETLSSVILLMSWHDKDFREYLPKKHKLPNCKEQVQLTNTCYDAKITNECLDSKGVVATAYKGNPQGTSSSSTSSGASGGNKVKSKRKGKTD